MLGRTTALGERHSLHVGGVLKHARAFQCFASGWPLRHGARLLQRDQRLHMQIAIGSIFVLIIHSKSLGGRKIGCLHGSGRWNRTVHRFAGANLRACRGLQESGGLVVKGKINRVDLAMVIAKRCVTVRTLSARTGTEAAAGRFLKN